MNSTTVEGVEGRGGSRDVEGCASILITGGSKEEEGPPLAASASSPGSHTASAALHDSLTPSTSATPPASLTASASTPPPGIPSTSTMTVTAFWKNSNIRQAVNFVVKAWGNTTKATVRHAWSVLLPQLKFAETKRQQPAERMNQVLETVRSIPAPGFQEVTREDLEDMMQEGNTNDVEGLLEDEECGDAGETEQRKVTTQKLSLLLGVFTSLQEMIQDIESESGEREQVIGVIEYISRKYQTQYNERVHARQQSLITRVLSQRRPAEEDQQREVEVDEDIDDIGEMPEGFDFVGFDEVLAEVMFKNFTAFFHIWKIHQDVAVKSSRP
ncbi:putative Tigger transposable element-derived protein 1-like 323 [Homarus americanus]|uniref:Putative Tigger transposable element-derived protein 1-like 323 n=1 Tax=Homarus americanus TaxID=6706 RepID=A0A8J5KDI4_HOMAM|nr:putative Tigger transposable element-derived protein 1-like 323 [Homarus americanus]